MEAVAARSMQAKRAYQLVASLQERLVARLEKACDRLGHNECFSPVSWLRDEGVHGGGCRMVAPEGGRFNRASVNISQVHYDDQPEKSLSSANALSTIIHPANPYVPSVHMHFSFTEFKDGHGYWRLMADLNPSLPSADALKSFREALENAAPSHCEDACRQGDRYFEIPSLGRHRGVYHFYLEGHCTEDFDQDLAFCQRVGHGAIDAYGEIFFDVYAKHPEYGEVERDQQLAYHSVYFLQVLTLDRGTTAGLMVHNQNDVGTLGSLPSHVDRDLLASWIALQPKPQDELLKALIDVLPPGRKVEINEAVKAQLAEAIRAHYGRFPNALDLQATGGITPKTISNHSN